MATWVDCTSGPSWFGGWAADMGEYIGPWPLMPTAVTDGLDPATFDAIEFVLGFDNPAHPGDPFYALDDTYDSPIWDAQRAMTAGGTPASNLSWFTSSVGAADSPDGLTPAPAGVHLWVVAYLSDDSVAPTVAPEAYVPPSYAAGGSATVQTLAGRWSDPQPGFPVSRSGAVIHENRWSASDSESVPDDTGSNLVLAQTAAAADLAAVVWDSEADGDQSFDGVRIAPDPPLLSGGTTSQIKAGQRAWSFSPAAMTNPTPDLSGLVFGVDYGYPPFGPTAYQYLADPTFTAWAPNTIDGITITYYRGRALEGADLDMVTGWLMQRIDALPEDGDTGAVFGTTLATLTVGGPGTPTDGAAGAPWSVDIPSDAGAPFVLVGTPAFLVDGVDSDFVPEIPEPGAAGIYSFIALDGDHDNSLAYTYEAGAWRYWIPGGVGPALVGFWGVRA